MTRIFQRAGFTLMEVNLAIFIMAVGVFSMCSLYTLGYRENRQSVEDVAGAAFADGLYTFAADAGLFAKGDNEFVVTATDRMTLNDFAVRVTWGR